jgi:integrase
MIIKHYLCERGFDGLHPDTLGQYAARLGAFSAWLDGRPITRETVAAFLASLDCADSTRAGYWRAIRAAVRWLVARGELPADTLAGFRPRFRKSPPRVAVMEPQLHTIIAAMDLARFAHRRDAALFAFIYYTGARVSEALAVRVADVQWTPGADCAGKVPIVGKGNRPAELAIPPRLARLLREWILQLSGPWLFPGVDQAGRELAHPPTRRTVEERWRAHVARAGLSPRLVIHGMRHGFVTHLHEDGNDIALISRAARHASIEITLEVYSHLAGAPVRRMLGKTFS